MGRQTTMKALVAAIFTFAAILTLSLSRYYYGTAEPGTGSVALGAGIVLLVAAIREWFLVARRT
jgi:uncharacterized membrane protein YphA (DoxX/SURF4 family)